MKTKRICKGFYQTKWDNHIIYISNEDDIEGQCTWAITSETLDVNAGDWDTLYTSKSEAIEMLPDILETSQPFI